MGDYLTSYTVDNNDLIVDIGGDWDDFATANDGSALADAVLGTSIWSHISGDTSRMFLDTLLRRARSTLQPIEKKYRCDTPTERRIMNMELIPQPTRRVTVRHSLVDAQRSDIVVNIIPGERSSDCVKRCTICNSIKLNGVWSDPFDLEGDQTYKVIYGICEKC